VRTRLQHVGPQPTRSIDPVEISPNREQSEDALRARPQREPVLIDMHGKGADDLEMSAPMRTSSSHGSAPKTQRDHQRIPAVPGRVLAGST
jgi:hypothetical protein